MDRSINCSRGVSRTDQRQNNPDNWSLSEGFGESTAEALAAHEPALLILTGRTKSKVQAVIESLTRKYPRGRYRFLELDLSSLAAVRKAAEEVKAYPDVPDIDIVICNAGVMWLPQHELSVDGVEMQFATNHLGHFLFVNLIMEKLIAAAQKSAPGAVRIINVSSLSAQFSPIRFSDINFTKAQPDMPEGERANLELMKAYGMPTEGIYNPITAYGQSKTANSLFSLELSHRLFDKYKIKSYSLHPGGILTDLWRHTDDQLVKQVVAGQEAVGGFKTLKQGSSTTLWRHLILVYRKRRSVGTTCTWMTVTLSRLRLGRRMLTPQRNCGS